MALSQFNNCLVLWYCVLNSTLSRSLAIFVVVFTFLHSLFTHRTLDASDCTRTAHITDLINLFAQLSFSTGLHTYSTTLARSFAVCLFNLYSSALLLTYVSSLSFVHLLPCFDGTACVSSLVYTTGQSGFDSVLFSSTVCSHVYSHLVYFISHTHCHTHSHSHLHSSLVAQPLSWLSFFDSDSRLIPTSWLKYLLCFWHSGLTSAFT